ncbi:methyltransferase domain-containing protein [Candidatus Thorarchaeota archaeon]|nr:MAG: methyltransferase domain-containing protein [Candidatus Thorarchaeota archaeon]
MEQPASHRETPLLQIRPPQIPQGLVLDIGGGGEGLVSRIVQERACAVDWSLSKLRGARIHGAKSEWIACDGRNLCFQEERFDVATLWFSLAYIPESGNKMQVLKEVSRVSKPEARLSILAMTLDNRSESFTFRATFTLPDEFESLMNYRVRGRQTQNLEVIAEALEETGFTTISSEEYEYWFTIEATKL